MVSNRLQSLAGLAMVASGIGFFGASVYLTFNGVLVAGLLSAALGLVLVSVGADMLRASSQS